MITEQFSVSQSLPIIDLNLGLKEVVLIVILENNIL